MKRVHRHANRIQLTLVWLLAGIVIACAPTFAYRHADWLVLWKVDHYFDLTKDQKVFVRARLKELLARHRHDALPAYEQFLSEIKLKSSDGLNRQEVDWIFSSYTELRADLLARIVSDSASFLTSVNEQQIQNLAEAFREDTEKKERVLKQKADARLAARATETLDRLKDWLGPLTREQKERVIQLSRSLPDMLGARLEFHMSRQHEVVRLLRTTRDPHVISQHLQDWLIFPEKSNPSQYQRALDEMKSAVKEMVIAVDHLITPQQRAHAQAKLQELINDIHALAPT
ncbi:MAG: DUF6279 family lipoprotein [Nitrospiraceae bacterium]